MPIIRIHYLFSDRDNASTSSADEKPMAMSAPQSTETKIEADDSGQVAAQTNPAPPAAHIPSGSRLLTQKALIVMSSFLLFVAMFLLHLSNMITDGSAVATAATAVTISAQVLISLSFYLDHKESGGQP